MLNDSEWSAEKVMQIFPLLLNIQEDTPPQGFSELCGHSHCGLLLEQSLSPVEAPSGSMGKRKDGWICQLPYSRIS